MGWMCKMQGVLNQKPSCLLKGGLAFFGCGKSLQDSMPSDLIFQSILQFFSNGAFFH